MAKNAFVPFTSRDSQKVRKKGGFVTGECALNACLSSGRCTHAHTHAGIQCSGLGREMRFQSTMDTGHSDTGAGSRSQILAPFTILQKTGLNQLMGPANIPAVEEQG